MSLTNSNLPPRTCPSLMDLSSFLDGQSSDVDHRAMEAHLAECATCMEAVRELHELVAETNPSMVLVPPQVAARAMALVAGVPAERHAFTYVRRAAAIAASLAIGALGYQVGTGLSQSNTAIAAPEHDASIDLFDASSDESIADLFVMETAQPEVTS